MKKLIFVTLILIIGCMTVSAKDINKSPNEKFKPRFSIGANAILEGGMEIGGKQGGSNAAFAPVVRPGISFDVQLSRHSGIETGIYYRMNYVHSRSISPTGSADDYIEIPPYRDNRILVPVYYKFYSRILNFAVGADVALNLNYDAQNSFSKADYALVLRLSKDITLYKGLYIEPLLQGSLGNIAWWGVGVGLKYRF